MEIIRHRKIYFAFSLALIVASIIILFVFGLRPGIDFTGGAIMELEYEDRPSNQEILEVLGDFDLGTVYVQPTGERGILIRMKDVSEDTHQQILAALSQSTKIEDGEMTIEIKEIEEIRFESIGPTIGQELKEKTSIVAIVALLSMIAYIAFAFRRVRRPIKSWQYGIISVIALFHDVMIPLGIFAILGKYMGVEITIPVITALLAVLGYSINNTVVVFDRIRENLMRVGDDFESTVNISINQTLSRQINTSLTTLFVAVAIYFFGGATLQYFALALILGILAGTYSSIFLAGPLLVSWYNLRYKLK
jgi:preprotein translocase subunit SecF